MNQGDWYGGSTQISNSGATLISKWQPKTTLDAVVGAAVVCELNVLNVTGNTQFIYLFDSAAIVTDGTLDATAVGKIVGVYRLGANDQLRIVYPGVGRPFAAGVTVQASTTNFPVLTTPASAGCFMFAQWGLYTP